AHPHARDVHALQLGPIRRRDALLRAGTPRRRPALLAAQRARRRAPEPVVPPPWVGKPPAALDGEPTAVPRAELQQLANDSSTAGSRRREARAATGTRRR